ncbi:polysaccharide biosynthesis/export family protein [Novosphingobium mangrovi (ex Hu et al. 2023)]|uniref:Polysaccharide export protein n=1 Tax=Novosphingobium mangrovi (ex Hu et al. 2023) TaxID=2930094 RepID=A0ABT0AC89_9SPHN|nr:polysaccharide biosynthesis/export family protein [Novosphingobium mangrovi (ex Hu et al. 2023)]MCJ1960812.1 polysaccharide export protein [Novosphingobium mangrovi (ex Hu et al. 2023)]
MAGAALLLAGCANNAAVPSSPEAQAAIIPPNPAPDYLLGPGDKISINIFGQPDMSVKDIIIDPQGRVSMPLIGSVTAEGLSSDRLEQNVVTALAPDYLRNPQVTVNVVEYASKQVIVDGQVNTPSVVPLFGTATLSEVIVKAGGPANLAKLSEVIVVRHVDGQRMAARFDLRAIRNGSLEDPVIYDGDRVFVGYNALKGLYQDALRAIPLIAVFQRF